MWVAAFEGAPGESAEALHRGVMARDTEAHLVSDAAYPGELSAVELGFVEQRRNSLTTREGADDGAVLRGHGIKVIGRLQAAGAAHVLRHNRRVAGNMLAQMPRHQSAVRVITAANAVADEERNGL